MSVTSNLPAKIASIPAFSRPAYDAIVSLSDRFCQAHLTHEYQMLCRKLAGLLARKRPSPLTRGKPEVWACAIVRVIGWVNFLSDSTQKPHMKLTAIDKAFGVCECTGQGKAMLIRKMLKIRPMEPAWSLRRHIEHNPLAWMIQVNGFLLDARFLKREIQEEALRKGLIPYTDGGDQCHRNHHTGGFDNQRRHGVPPSAVSLIRSAHLRKPARANAPGSTY